MNAEGIHLVVVDALNLLRRLFAVRENMEDCKTALEHSLRRLEQELEPTHGCVVFDGGHDTWRHRSYPAYKEGRSPMPDILRQGLPELVELFRQKGWFCIRRRGVEADDLVASIACQVIRKTSVVRATIVSTDKMYAQLLPYGVNIRDHFNRHWVSEQDVVERFGVCSTRLVDLWGLAGDSTNNIAGIAGVGQKTAAKLLDQYGSLEAVLAAANQVAGKLGEKIALQQEQARLAKMLVELKVDLDLGLNLRQLRLPGK